MDFDQTWYKHKPTEDDVSDTKFMSIGQGSRSDLRLSVPVKTYVKGFKSASPSVLVNIVKFFAVP